MRIGLAFTLILSHPSGTGCSHASGLCELFAGQICFPISKADKHSPDRDGNNKKRSHTQLDSRKQVIAFQDRVITINVKEAQHPLK